MLSWSLAAILEIAITLRATTTVVVASHYYESYSTSWA